MSPATLSAAVEAARDQAVVAEASTLGLVAFEGNDAQAFLHSQLSNDVQALPRGMGQWTSYNSPKGRVLATLYLWRESEDRYRAILAADLAAAVAKRLTMFVLRSKVTVSDLTTTYGFVGVGGPGATSVVDDALAVAPSPGEVATRDGANVLHWPDRRIVVLAARAAFDAIRESLAMHATLADAVVWDWLAVRAGVPMITAATQDRFVAQTLNWDAIGGLDFRKGCYPGQEIVARTQHLGRLKERLFAFECATLPPPPGTRLYSSAFGEQPSGTVVNSAPDPGGSIFLAVAQIEAADQGAMAIGAADGPRATRTALPYDVPVLVPKRTRIDA